MCVCVWQLDLPPCPEYPHMPTPLFLSGVCGCRCSPYLPSLRRAVTAAPPVSTSNAMGLQAKKSRHTLTIHSGVSKHKQSHTPILQRVISSGIRLSCFVFGQVDGQSLQCSQMYSQWNDHHYSIPDWRPCIVGTVFRLYWSVRLSLLHCHASPLPGLPARIQGI